MASGTARVGLCSVTALTIPDPSTGIQLRWALGTMPTSVEILAPSSLLDLNLSSPIELEVRTTIGVLRVQIPPPPPLTDEDLKRLRSGVLLQLQLCDAKIKPAWFFGHGHFDLDWIVRSIDRSRPLQPAARVNSGRGVGTSERQSTRAESSK